MGRLKGVKETGEYSLHRKLRSKERSRHKAGIETGEIAGDYPLPLVPMVFSKLEKTYWNCLKEVEDPRRSKQVVYPLDKILHRVLSGLMLDANYVGVLFPKIHTSKNKKKGEHLLGSLPTQKTVYLLLRRIDWSQANLALSPLWKALGYTPDLIASRKLRDPKEILDEFVLEKAREKGEEEKHQKSRRDLRNKKERYEGLSASEAKKRRRSRKKNPFIINRNKNNLS